MKVEDICTRTVKTCTPETSLAAAGHLMWEAGCAALPVVDEAGRVVGLLTDRDVCMAVAVTGQPAPSLPVRVAAQPLTASCRPQDDVRDALRILRVNKLRRLPVLDGDGVLRGMLSLHDLVLAAKSDAGSGPADVSYEDLALALKTICAFRRPEEAPAPAPESATYV